LTVLVAVLVLACGGPDAARYAATLDEIAVSEDWEAARTIVHAPGGDIDCTPTPFSDCPYVVRFYIVDGTQVDTYQELLAAVTLSGFTLQREFDPECDGQTDPCGFTALREADQIFVAVYPPGRDDGTGVARADRVTARVTVGK
jgi:hypothetical protein